MFRVLLADDEQTTLNLLESLIHWEELELLFLGDAQNGNDLCEKVEELCPHIVLIDMNMPGIHGAELIEYLTRLTICPKIIVVSGYDDFSYTKAAIDSRVTGYLLKPVDETELNAALRKAVQELLSEQHLRQKSILASISERNFQNYLSEQSFWEHLEHGNFTPTCIIPFLPKGQDHIDFFQICIFRIPNLKEITMQTFQGASSLSLFAIKNILDEIFSDYGICYCNNQSKDILLLITKKITPAILKKKLEYAHITLYKDFLMQAFVGISQAESDYTQLQQQYTSATYAADNMNLFTETHTSFYQNTVALDAKHSSIYEELLDNAYQKSISLFLQTATNIFRTPQKYNINTISDILQLLDYIYKQVLCHPEISKNSELQTIFLNFYHEVHSPFSISSILSEWTLISTRISDTLCNDIQIGKKIKRYIDAHYQQAISISELAEKYHLSRQHLYRLFKAETGLSPYSYILNKKIEKSKILLLNPEIKLSEIATLLNFTDESHFSHAFKKITSFSPKQYRSIFSEYTEKDEFNT